MDITALQQKVDDLKAKIIADQSALDQDNSDLKTAEAELAQASLINSILALTADEITIINQALAADPSNTIGVSINFQAPASQETPPASPALM